MFQFPGFTFIKLCIHFMIHGVSHVSFLIRKSSDLWLCASTRSLSQLIASFIGSWCQGIHHAPFVAWPFACLVTPIASSSSEIFSFTYIIVRSLENSIDSLHLSPLDCANWFAFIVYSDIYYNLLQFVLIISQRIFILGFVVFIYINLCAIFKEHFACLLPPIASSAANFIHLRT